MPEPLGPKFLVRKVDEPFDSTKALMIFYPECAKQAILGSRGLPKPLFFRLGLARFATLLAPQAVSLLTADGRLDRIGRGKSCLDQLLDGIDADNARAVRLFALL